MADSRLAFSILVWLIAGIAPREAIGAVIAVTTTAQKIGGAGGCSLQEAIFSANFDASLAIAGYTGTTPNFISTECVPGSGDDIIVLPVGAVFSLSRIVDDAVNPTGPMATPIITSNITILAYGATLQRASTSSSSFRLFAIGDTGHLTLRRAYVRGFRARGGGGRDAGGGGMGAGGAIYVKRGGLVIEGSTFQEPPLRRRAGTGRPRPASARRGTCARTDHVFYTHKLWPDGLRKIDTLLEDEAVIETVAQAMEARWPQSRRRGRLGMVADVVLQC